MDHIDENKFEAVELTVLQSNFTFSVFGRGSLKALKRLFQPYLDLNRLNGRLRRDAGLDEHEIERAVVTRAPLIR